MLDAAVAAGAPEGIIDWVDVPSLELTNLAMKEADLILATGGPGMVKSAYSSGKPAIGVGSGNVPAIIDDSADILLAVSSIIIEQDIRQRHDLRLANRAVIVVDSVYNKVKKEFADRGCYILKRDETEKVRKTILINGALNAKIVGQTRLYHRETRGRDRAGNDEDPHRRGREPGTLRRVCARKALPRARDVPREGL